MNSEGAIRGVYADYMGCGVAPPALRRFAAWRLLTGGTFEEFLQHDVANSEPAAHRESRFQRAFSGFRSLLSHTLPASLSSLPPSMKPGLHVPRRVDMNTPIYDGNPHSAHALGRAANASLAEARTSLLRFFGAERDYIVVLTSGATGALKLAGELFAAPPRTSENGTEVEERRTFISHWACHNSALGIRGLFVPHSDGDCSGNHAHADFANSEVIPWGPEGGHQQHTGCSSVADVAREVARPAAPHAAGLFHAKPQQRRRILVVYPLECNFSGARFPADQWAATLHAAARDANMQAAAAASSALAESPSVTPSVSKYYSGRSCVGNNDATTNHLFILVDGAAAAGKLPIALDGTSIDGFAISCYKMAGLPFGLGALFLRRAALPLLRKLGYFGGGTVDAVAFESPYVRFRVSYQNPQALQQASSVPSMQAADNDTSDDGVVLAAEALEDGTQNIGAVALVPAALHFLTAAETLEERATRLHRLRQRLVERLKSLHHAGNAARPVVRIFEVESQPAEGQIGAASTACPSLLMDGTIAADTPVVASILAVNPSIEHGLPIASPVDVAPPAWRMQGPTVACQILDPNGAALSHIWVEKCAVAARVALRTGCFCNAGACAHFLGLTEADIRKNYDERAMVCGGGGGGLGDDVPRPRWLPRQTCVRPSSRAMDASDSTPSTGATKSISTSDAPPKPSGAVRISLGWATTDADVDAIIQWVESTFVSHALAGSPASHALSKLQHVDSTAEPLRAEATITRMWVYPLKGVSGVEASAWPLQLAPSLQHVPVAVAAHAGGDLGGLVLDRRWTLIDAASGAALTPKRHPALGLLRQALDVEAAQMVFWHARAPAQQLRIVVPRDALPFLALCTPLTAHQSPASASFSPERSAGVGAYRRQWKFLALSACTVAAGVVRFCDTRRAALFRPALNTSVTVGAAVAGVTACAVFAIRKSRDKLIHQHSAEAFPSHMAHAALPGDAAAWIRGKALVGSTYPKEVDEWFSERLGVQCRLLLAPAPQVSAGSVTPSPSSSLSSPDASPAVHPGPAADASNMGKSALSSFANRAASTLVMRVEAHEEVLARMPEADRPYVPVECYRANVLTIGGRASAVHEGLYDSHGTECDDTMRAPLAAVQYLGPCARCEQVGARDTGASFHQPLLALTAVAQDRRKKAGDDEGTTAARLQSATPTLGDLYRFHAVGTGAPGVAMLKCGGVLRAE
jgi:selenocysteine lyase/cysteine desulfurase